MAKKPRTLLLKSDGSQVIETQKMKKINVKYPPSVREKSGGKK